MRAHLRNLSHYELEDLDALDFEVHRKPKFQPSKTKLLHAAKLHRKNKRRRKAQRIINGFKYDDYIHSRAWNDKRFEAFKRANWQCQVCGQRKRLTGHHLTYKNFGNENPEDILAVCEQCHDRIDGTKDKVCI